MDKKNKKKVLPAVLMAGALAVPSAASAAPLADNFSVDEERSFSATTVTDSQAAWSNGSVENVYQAQWAEVTWGKVVWARAGEPENRT